MIIINDEGNLRKKSMKTIPSVQAQYYIGNAGDTGIADCPKCKSLQSVARRNANWTCHKCAHVEVFEGCVRIISSKGRKNKIL